MSTIIIEELEQVRSKLLPWWSDFRTEYPLAVKTEPSAEQYLNRFYLFPLAEITVNNRVEDIPKFIVERYQTVLSAAYTAGISVATIIKGNKGRINVNLGFVAEDDSKTDPEYFQSIINGVLPGERIELKATLSLSALVKNLPKGGVVTGIPALKNDDERQQFNLSSVLRSMYGRDYILITIAKPVNRSEMQQRLIELLNFRDNCHKLAKSTVGEEKGAGRSTTENEQTTTGTSETRGHNAGVFIGAGIPLTPIGGVNYSHNWSKASTSSETKGTAQTVSEQHAQSFSVEQQNGFALELEKIADHFIERMKQGFNTGYWETAITFAAQDKISCDILGGSFIGELSKPSDKLYPPRLYTADIDPQKLLFLPKTDSSNPIFPKSLASYITSQELSQLAAPPTESLPGYEIKKMPPLALTDIPNQGEITLGAIADYGNPLAYSFITLSKDDLNKHLFVCGLTGSGKTTTIKHILKSISQNESVPFLVLESAKRDYRQLLADDIFKDKLNIFTVGDATVNPIRFNPFYVQKGVHPLVHIDYLKAIFNASFSLYGPMPHIVEKCLHNIYLKKNWNLTSGIHPNFLDAKGQYDESNYNTPEHRYCFPTLTDLKDEVNSYVKNELDYKGELSDNIRTAIVARLESLCVGAKGLMFNTYEFYPVEKLLKKSAILEMESLVDDDDKAFFVGFMLVLISEHRQKNNPAVNPGSNVKGLQHFLVIEEAHRLLKNVNTERTSEMMGNPKGKAVEVFCNVISEMRSLGQGVAVVEQIPTKISPDVIKNSNTKIVHRLVSKDDQSLLAGSLSISDDDALYLNRLKTGHALCHKEGMERPVECVVLNDVKTHAISDDKIKRVMQSDTVQIMHSFKAYELAGILKESGKEITVRFLNSLCVLPFSDFPKLVATLNAALNKALILRNSIPQVNDKEIADFIAMSILEFLTRGVYSKRTKLPSAFNENVVELLTTNNITRHKTVLELLSNYWGVDAKFYVEDVVGALTERYLIYLMKKARKPLPFGEDSLKRTAALFFLIPDEQVVTKLSQRIMVKHGGTNG